jgi:glycosyltransferase involved in cell wall biosynthesis
MPKISVIMPTYNGQLFIEQAINSVLCQSMSDLELIVVDDGSTDNTSAILEKISKIDPRLRIISRSLPSGGPTIPKNQALSVINSEYVCFLDHDDYYHQDKLKFMCDGMDTHPQWVAAFHDVQLVDVDQKKFQGTYLSNANFLDIASNYLNPIQDSWFECRPDFYNFMSLYYAAMHTDSVIIAPQRLLADPVSFRKCFRGSDDTDLWLRIGFQGTVGYLNTALAFYRQHENNLSTDKIKMTENAIELHQVNYMQAKHVLDTSQLAAYRKKILSYQLDLAYFLYTKKEFSKARSVYSEITKGGAMLNGIKGILKTYLFQFLPGLQNHQ